jgi:hypothetical protein
MERTEPGQRNRDGLLIWAAWDFDDPAETPRTDTPKPKEGQP